MRLVQIAALGLASFELLAPSRPIFAAAPPRPDLRVSVELHKEQKQGKWFVRMRFTVSNVGGALAPQSVLGAWCQAAAGGPCPPVIPSPNYKVGAVVVPGATGAVHLTTPLVPAGGSVFVLGPSTQEWPNGNYTITARADLPNHVAEANEANNDGSAHVTIP